MKRREIIQAAFATSFMLISNKINLLSDSKIGKRKIKPNKLNFGDKVGIIAPATFSPSAEGIDKATQAIGALGLIPQFGKTFYDKSGWKTKPIDLRVEEIAEMFTDKTVKAVFCIRGGYGSIGIVDKIDYSIIEQNPKIFVGFSDITALHIGITQNTGLTTLHSPMLLSDYKGSFDLLKKYLFTNEPIGELKNLSTDEIRRRSHFVIKNGNAKGELVGGNLSLITSLIGTKFEIETDEKILFLEDVGEEPYRIDRMLHQLRLSGKLDKLRGLVFGLCTDCEPKGVPIWDKSLLDVLIEHFGHRPYPSFYGLTIGHTPNQIPLPIGLTCELNSDNGTLNITESYCK